MASTELLDDVSSHDTSSDDARRTLLQRKHHLDCSGRAANLSEVHLFAASQLMSPIRGPELCCLCEQQMFVGEHECDADCADVQSRRYAEHSESEKYHAGKYCEQYVECRYHKAPVCARCVRTSDMFPEESEDARARATHWGRMLESKCHSCGSAMQLVTTPPHCRYLTCDACHDHISFSESGVDGNGAGANLRVWECSSAACRQSTAYCHYCDACHSGQSDDERPFLAFAGDGEPPIEDFVDFLPDDMLEIYGLSRSSSRSGSPLSSPLTKAAVRAFRSDLLEAAAVSAADPEQ